MRVKTVELILLLFSGGCVTLSLCFGFNLVSGDDVLFHIWEFPYRSREVAFFSFPIFGFLAYLLIYPKIMGKKLELRKSSKRGNS